ncbi:hypothetical protein RJ55_06244 [Drechmeria coniospora]|nr:hypothetical protein RJ55_06244 [Drechmeria coniospora]
MNKEKKNNSVQNKILYSRVSYLYQAANYLSGCADRNRHGALHPVTRDDGSSGIRLKAAQNISRSLTSDLRAVALKGQIRLSPAMKQTICKFCETLLVEGQTCHSVIENTSKGGRKPWADILVTKCATCGRSKRYPVSAKQQMRRAMRTQASAPAVANLQTSKAGDARSMISTVGPEQHPRAVDVVVRPSARDA